jgi:uncharacterized protein (TIGR01777 family)
MVKHIVLSGGAGFVGSHLAAALLARGYRVTIVDRHEPRDKNPTLSFVRADLMHSAPEVFAEADGIIHLSGANIFARWTSEYKKTILESRTRSIENILSVVARSSHKPEVFVCASAVGYYGDRGDEELKENALPGDDFLASVCVAWEAAAAKAESLGMRRVSVRTAIVLGPNGGTLSQLIPLYNFGLGGPMGSGKQWFSWISIDDLVSVYIAAIENKNLTGPVNAVAPGIVRNRDFAKAMGRALHRLAFLPTPAWALRLVLGEFAVAVLSSQKAIPEKLLASGFRFAYPDIDSALTYIFRLS